MELEHILCLNGCPLPVERRTMDFEDINECCNGDADDKDFVLLDLKAGAPVAWLEKHLKVRSKFWRHRHGELPLVQEMRMAIDTGKRRRSTRRTGVVVGIKVRDKVVFVQNKSGLVLAAHAGEEKETIRWFLEEIEKDVKLIGPAPMTFIEKDDREQVDEDDPEQVPIDKVLKEIRGHPQCHKINFATSRGCFQIIKKNIPQNESEVKCIYIKGFTKIRKDFLQRVMLVDGEESLDDRAVEVYRRVFEQALIDCTQYLELAIGDSSSSRVSPGA
jgi:hypothetical protein